MKKTNNLESELGKSLKSDSVVNPNNLNATQSAVSFIIVLAITILMSLSLTFIMLYNDGNLTGDDMVDLLISLLLAQLVILFVGLVFCKIYKINPFKGGGFVCKKAPIQTMMGILLITGMMALFMPVAVEFIYSWPLSYSSSTDTEGNMLVALVVIVLIPIAPAICEELLYRGVIMRGLLTLGAVPAIILSSLMFSFMHGSIQQMLYQFLVGLAIGSVVYLTKNYLVGCLMHFFNNFLSQVTAVFYEFVGYGYEGMYNAFFIIIGTACLLIAGVYFLQMMLAKEIQKALKINKNSEFDSCAFLTTE